jgi:pilus assembly protein Flp/PilA
MRLGKKGDHQAQVCPPAVRGARARQRGVTAIEYALIASLIAVAVIGGIQTLGSEVSNTFDTVSTAVSGATNN